MEYLSTALAQLYDHLHWLHADLGFSCPSKLDVDP